MFAIKHRWRMTKGLFCVVPLFVSRTINICHLETHILMYTRPSQSNMFSFRARVVSVRSFLCGVAFCVSYN